MHFEFQTYPILYVTIGNHPYEIYYILQYCVDIIIGYSSGKTYKVLCLMSICELMPRMHSIFYKKKKKHSLRGIGKYFH